MADKLKEFVRQSIDELLKSLPPEERLKGLSADEVARALPPETLEELARRFKANRSSPGDSVTHSFPPRPAPRRTWPDPGEPAL
jgi:hypothetical protein